MKFFKKLFRIIRTCNYCGKEYHKDDKSYRKGKRLNLNMSYERHGGIKMSPIYPMYECCKACNIKWKEEQDMKYGLGRLKLKGK